MSTRRLEAVLIDLDGTLLDSLPSLRAAYQEFLRLRHVAPSEAEFQTLNGPPLSRIVEILAERHRLSGSHSSLLAEYVELLEAGYVREARLKPGADAFLGRAAAEDLFIALVTSAPAGLARSVLRARGVEDYFDVIVGGDSVEHGKPAPDCYLAALTGCGVTASRALALEDSPSGIRASVAAGVRCVAVGRSQKPALLRAGAATVVADLDEAQELMGSLILGPGRVMAASEISVRLTGPAPELDSTQEREVDLRWEQAVGRRPGLTDGTVLALLEWQRRGSVLSIATLKVAYRQFIAQRDGLPLGIFPLGVSGAVRLSTGEFVLGLRSAAVTQYPGHWELVPSGGIPWERVHSDGHVDVESQLVAEAEEELGLTRDKILRIAPLGLIEDLSERVYDVAYLVEARLESRDIARHSAGEYDELRALSLDEILSFMTRNPTVPLVGQLLGLLPA